MMKTDPQQVRLPELPIFKKYSLALRDEYARASDVLALLERTSARIQQMVDKAEEALRRQEEAELAAAAAVAEEIQVEEPVLEAVAEPEDEAEPEEEDATPFWEMDLPEEDPPTTTAPKAKPKGRAIAKPAPKKKSKVVRTGIVHVGAHGKPMAKKTTAAKPKPKPKAKPSAKSKSKVAAAKKKRR